MPDTTSRGGCRCGAAPDGKATVAVSLRCLEGLDVAALPVRRFDGASR